MKFIGLILFFLLSTFTYGQNTLPNMGEDIIINENLVAKPGECYIDGIKVELDKTIIHENNIKSIKSYKGESSKIYSGAIGATIINRKNHYKFVNLCKFVADIKKGNDKLKEQGIVEVIVNGVLIEKPAEFQIEINPDLKITIQNYSDDGVYHGGKENKPKTQIIIETKK